MILLVACENETVVKFDSSQYIYIPRVLICLGGHIGGQLKLHNNL